MTVDREDASHLRVPPHSSEAEQGLLGALLFDAARIWDRVSDLVGTEDFYRREHRLIFSAIGTLEAACKQVDAITVFERLQAAGEANDAGGLTYLHQLAEAVPSMASARRYAEIIRERSMRRQLIAVGDEIATAGFRTDEDLTEQMNAVADRFSALNQRQVKKGPVSIGDLATRAIDRYTDLSLGNMKPGISTGIKDLDRLLAGRGLVGGKVYGIAARPSVGKSSIARAVAINVAMHDTPVLVLSQEMPADEVTDCVISALGQIENDHLQSGELTDADWGNLTSAAETAARLPLYIDDQGGLTLNDIRVKARAIKGIGCIVLDYLQLTTSLLKGQNREAQVADISRGLKQLAMAMNVPVIVLSQLNRAVEGRADKEPELSDLRESGAIEQDLDVAWFLWTMRFGTDSRTVGNKIAKQRGGKLGRFALEFIPSTYQWRASTASMDPPTPTERRGKAFE